MDTKSQGVGSRWLLTANSTIPAGAPASLITLYDPTSRLCEDITQDIEVWFPRCHADIGGGLELCCRWRWKPGAKPCAIGVDDTWSAMCRALTTGTMCWPLGTATGVEKGMGMDQNNAMIVALFAIVFLFVCVKIGAIIFICLALCGDTCRILRCQLIDRTRHCSDI